MSPAAKRRFWAVVPAAGRGARFASAEHARPKQYAPLAGATVLDWSLAALLQEPLIETVVVALAADDDLWRGVASAASPAAKVKTTVGGATRSESVLNGLAALDGLAAVDDWIVVHDAARPCLTGADLSALIAVLATPGAEAIPGALLASPIVDTVKRERSGIAVDTVERAGLWRALTPQAFSYGRLRQALEEVRRLGIGVTDEAQAMERLGLPGALVRGSPLNIKVTTIEDLRMAEAILRGAASSRSRIGQGFDVHAFGPGDGVTLGGVKIAHARGIVAHSDGDVVIHALCDAILGALGQGDIGQHFPDTDPNLRGADSRLFLRQVAALMRTAGYLLVNADVSVLAEAPRIAKHRLSMAANLAADLGVEAAAINVKATTTERLGFIGRGEGLAASASVLLESAATQPRR